LVTIFFHRVHPSILRLPYWAFSKHLTSHHHPGYTLTLHYLLMPSPLKSQFYNCWYMPVYHTGISFCSWISSWHFSVYRHYIPLSFSIFLTVYPCFAFKNYTGTSRFHFEHCWRGCPRVQGS
jgi:hypothetical protein